MTVEELKSQTRKDLAGMAKTRGVAGWHAMRKDELVQALSRLARRDRRKNGSTAPIRRPAAVRPSRHETDPANGNSTNGKSRNVRMRRHEITQRQTQERDQRNADATLAERLDSFRSLEESRRRKWGG